MASVPSLSVMIETASGPMVDALGASPAIARTMAGFALVLRLSVPTAERLERDEEGASAVTEESVDTRTGGARGADFTAADLA